MSLSQPGVWSWFSSPQAIFANNTTYISYATLTHVEIGAFDHTAQTWTTFQLGELTATDDHSVPVVRIRPDGRLLVVWTEHGDGLLFRRVSTNPGDVTSWGPVASIGTEPDTYTYANLMRQDPEDTWYLFSRRTGLPHDWVFFTSDDEGDTWSTATELVTGASPDADRPYPQFHSSGSRIDIAITSSHPETTDDNSLWHFFYDGAWRDSAGVDLGAPPFVVTDFTQVYDGTDPLPDAWTWDIAPGPNIVFATFPSDTDHRYQYAHWTGAAWDVNEIVAAGGSIDDSGADPNYSGGIGLDHADPGTVYLSRQNGDAWNMERWVTTDDGDTWGTPVNLTPGTAVKNARPIVPLGGGPVDVVWWAGSYFSFTSFDTHLVTFPELLPPVTVQQLAPIVSGSHRAVFSARVLTTFQTGDDPDGTDIPILGGDVQYDATAEIFATLSLTTSGISEIDRTSLFPRRAGDLLAPYGNEVFVRRGVDIGSQILWSPLGYFRIDDTEQPGASDSPIRLAGSDRMSGIIDGRLTEPVQYPSTATIGDVVTDLVTGIYPDAEIVFDDDSRQQALGRQLVVEEDRYAALLDIAQSLGKVVFWDGQGFLRITDAPDPAEITWEIKAGHQGVLVDSGREVSREGMYNGVVATGQGATESPVRAVAVDTGVNSPTRWGGRFGRVPRFYSSPLLTTEGQALSAAASLVRRYIGMPYNVNFGAIPNPALRPRDVVRVTQKDGNREKHIIETHTIPLSAETAASATTREQTLQTVGQL